jgi:hypothetical protein
LFYLADSDNTKRVKREVDPMVSFCASPKLGSKNNKKRALLNKAADPLMPVLWRVYH